MKARFLEKKSVQQKPSWAATGLYFYDNQIIDIAASLKSFPHGELEFIDGNSCYLERWQRDIELLGRAYTRLVAGTPDNLMAADCVQTLKQVQQFMICYPKEIAFRLSFFDETQLKMIASKIGRRSNNNRPIQILRSEGWR